MKEKIAQALEQLQYAYASLQTVNIGVTRENVTGMAGCILRMEDAMKTLRAALDEGEEAKTDV